MTATTKGKVSKAGRDSILVDDALGAPELAKIAALAKRASAGAPITRLALTRVKLADASALASVLGAVPKLRELVIYGGKIADWTPLAAAKSLRSLFLNGVAMDKDLPPTLGTLGKLTELSLLHLPKLANIDLSGCTKLARFAVYSCKKLRDLTSLHALPALREVTLVDTAHAPKDLARIIALPQVKHVSAQFGSVRLNKAFEALLAKHGKTQH